MLMRVTDPGEPFRLGHAGAFQINPPILIPRIGLIRAWDMNAVSGNDVTSVPAAFGTSTALAIAGSSGSADVATAISPAGNNLLQTTGSNSEVGTFTSTGAMSNFTVAFVFAPTGLSGSTIVPILSKTTDSTQSYLYWTPSSGQIIRLTYRPDSGAAANFDLNTNQYMNNGGCYVVVIRRQSGVGMTVRVNGVAKSLVVGNAFTFNQMFRATNTNYATALWGRFAIWNRALSEAEMSQVEAVFGNDISRGLYVSNSVGNDTTNFGFSAATPLKTIAAATNKTQIVTNGLAIGNFGVYLKSGDTFNGEPITPPVSGTTLFKFIVDVYGGSSRTHVDGVAGLVGGWTDNGDGTYSRALSGAYDPGFVEQRSASSAPGKLYDKLYNAITGGSPPSIGKFTRSGSTLTITPLAGFNPATTEVRIAPNNGTKCFDFGTVNIIVRNLDMWFWVGIVVKPSGTGGTLLFENCSASYSANDGLDMSGSVVMTFNDCEADNNGQNPLTSGEGDGFSAHGGSVITYNRCKARFNRNGGLLSEAHTTEVANGCYFEGNRNDVLRLAQGTGSGGSLTLTNCIIKTTNALSEDDYGIEMETGLTGCTYAFRFVTIYGDTGLSGTSKGIAIEGGAGGTITDCIVSGSFNSGIAGNGGATGVQTYNCLNASIPVSGGGITGGTGTITSNPLLTDPTNNDFTLQVASPCVGAGIAISGVTTDYTGATRANPPSIGAYET